MWREPRCVKCLQGLPSMGAALRNKHLTGAWAQMESLLTYEQELSWLMEIPATNRKRASHWKMLKLLRSTHRMSRAITRICSQTGSEPARQTWYSMARGTLQGLMTTAPLVWRPLRARQGTGSHRSSRPESQAILKYSRLTSFGICP